MLIASAGGKGIVRRLHVPNASKPGSTLASALLAFLKCQRGLQFFIFHFLCYERVTLKAGRSMFSSRSSMKRRCGPRSALDSYEALGKGFALLTHNNTLTPIRSDSSQLVPNTPSAQRGRPKHTLERSRQDYRHHKVLYSSTRCSATSISTHLPAHRQTNRLSSNMIKLLSLPNELLIQVLSASPTARMLCDLANINKRMRAIWLRHSEGIIADVFNPKIPYFQDAVDFTLAEARRAGSMRPDAVKSEAQPLYIHLPRILQNVDLAAKTCDRYTEFRRSCTRENPWDEGPVVHSAYFFIRRAALGYILPDMRPGLRSELRFLPTIDVKTSDELLSYISDFAPYTLRCELECVLTEEEMERVPVDDRMTRLTLGWRYAYILVGLALREKELNVTGMLEGVWTGAPVNEEDLEWSSDSGMYPLEYTDSELEEDQ